MSYLLGSPMDFNKQRSLPVLEELFWLNLLVLFLFLSAAAQVVFWAAPMALLVACAIFLVPFFGVYRDFPVRLLIVAVTTSLVVTAFYAPIVGVFMGIEGGANVFLIKAMLGVRSGFFALWIFLALIVLAFSSRSPILRFVPFAIIIILTVGVFSHSGRLEPKMTYLLNSFLPLFSVVAVLPWIMVNANRVEDYSGVLKAGGLVVAFTCAAYYPFSVYFFDVFRPDLALFHQSSAALSGGAVAGSAPSQWNTLLYGYRIPRFVGTFPNPILFGYFCAVLSFCLYVRGERFTSALMGILVLLSLSKGAWLLLVSGHIFLILARRGNRAFVAGVVLLLVFELSAAYLLDGSNRVHLRGLMGGLGSLLGGTGVETLIGFGVGSGGNLARGYLEGGVFSSGWLASGSESGIGVLAYQLGFIGLSLFAFLVFQIFKTAMQKGPDGDLPTKDVRYGILALSTAWFCNMLLQEDLINVTVGSVFLYGAILIAGAARRSSSALNSRFRAAPD